MNNLKTHELRRRDHQLAGDVIGASFTDDPVNIWVFGKARGLARYYSLSAKKLYLHQGYGHRVGTDGCSLWLPPKVKKHIPLWQSLDIAASMIWNDGFGAVARGVRIDAGLEQHHPEEPHHYLFALGTRPEKQGTGIGSQLMRAGLRRADADQLPAYLESSNESNVPFYQRFGFEVTQKLTPTAGCPPLWLMWREPR